MKHISQTSTDHMAMTQFIDSNMRMAAANRLAVIDRNLLENAFGVFYHQGEVICESKLQPEYYSLLFCKSGSITCSINQFQFKAEQGSIHFTSPYAQIDYRDASPDIELYILIFKSNFLSDGLIKEARIENILNANPESAPVFLLNMEKIELVEALFNRLLVEFNTRQPFHGRMLRLLFIELLLEITRANDDYETRFNNQHLVNRQKQLTSQFKKNIDEHYLQLRSVQEYADRLFVTSKHLSEVVKQETGLTPLHFIHNRIFQQAKFLLCSSEMSVKEIADNLKFDTSSHFSRFFRQFAGHNPTDFRKIQCSII